MKVTTSATSLSDMRPPNPGMPRLDGAVIVARHCPAIEDHRISEVGFSARTVRIFGECGERPACAQAAGFVACSAIVDIQFRAATVGFAGGQVFGGAVVGFER